MTRVLPATIGVMGGIVMIVGQEVSVQLVDDCMTALRCLLTDVDRFESCVIFF